MGQRQDPGVESGQDEDGSGGEDNVENTEDGEEDESEDESETFDSVSDEQVEPDTKYKVVRFITRRRDSNQSDAQSNAK